MRLRIPIVAGIKSNISAQRHYGFVVAFAVVCIGFIFGYIWWYVLPHQEPVVDVTFTPVADTATSTYARSMPTRLLIPSIHIDTTFVSPLGLMPDQTVAVPATFDQVGWYSGGVSPGEIGSSVILGHVDSKAGPAIFYSLGQVNIGDEVTVERADGTEAVFTVYKLERHPQSDFPTMAVYGPTDAAELRLITCSGLYNHGSARYSHNLIVFARLKTL